MVEPKPQMTWTKALTSPSGRAVPYQLIAGGVFALICAGIALALVPLGYFARTQGAGIAVASAFVVMGTLAIGSGLARKRKNGRLR